MSYWQDWRLAHCPECVLRNHRLKEGDGKQNRAFYRSFVDFYPHTKSLLQKTRLELEIGRHFYELLKRTPAEKGHIYQTAVGPLVVCHVGLAHIQLKTTWHACSASLTPDHRHQKCALGCKSPTLVSDAPTTSIATMVERFQDNLLCSLFWTGANLTFSLSFCAARAVRPEDKVFEHSRWQTPRGRGRGLTGVFLRSHGKLWLCMLLRLRKVFP